MKLDAEHMVWPWLVEYAAYLLTRAEVGADGKTAYERSRGKVAKLVGVEFAEGVLWKRRREGGPLGKLTCMWEDGIFLGVKGSTGEMIVGDEKGVWRTRSIRRKPAGERWSRENMGRIGGVPWKMTKESEGDGEELKNEVTIMDKDYRERAREEEHEAVPRKVYISKDDLEIHGYTVGCPGCKSVLRGTTRQGHTEGCRRRVEKELEGTEKAMRAKKKVNEYVDKKMTEDEEARRVRSEAKKMKMDGTNEMEVDEKERGDEDDKKRKADGTVLTPDTDKKAKAKESSMGKVAPGAFDSKAKEERVEVSRKRPVKDEDNEEKTAKYIKKLEQKEKKKKRERERGR